MNRELPFDSIDSAHEFVTLFANVVLDTKRDIDTDIQRMSSNVSRRLDALQIVAYKLETLELHLTKSRRILTDLRSLRRLLFGERTNGALAVRPTTATGIAKAETPPSPSPEVSHSGVSPDSAVARHASICATTRKRVISSPRDAHASNVERLMQFLGTPAGLQTCRREKNRERQTKFSRSSAEGVQGSRIGVS